MALNKFSARFDLNQVCICVPTSGKNAHLKGAKFFGTLKGSEVVGGLHKTIQVNCVFICIF